MNKIPGKFSVILRTLFFPLFSTQLINVRRFGAVNLDFFFLISHLSPLSLINRGQGFAILDPYIIKLLSVKRIVKRKVGRALNQTWLTFLLGACGCFWPVTSAPCLYCVLRRTIIYVNKYLS